MSTLKTIQPPQLTDLLLNLKEDIFRSLHCIKIGEIQSFNAIQKTVSVQILFKKVVGDSSSPSGQTVKSYPVLLDCPVFTLQGDGAGIEFPIVKGDQCVVLFSDRNIDAWLQTGKEGVPYSLRTHDLSDAIALVGINAITSTLPNYQANKVRLFYGNNIITLNKNGDIQIAVNAGNKLSVTDGSGAEILGTSSLALKSDVQSLVDTFKTHTHPDPVSGSTGVPTQQPTNPTGTTKLKGS